MRVLILGGTTEGRDLAERLARARATCTSSPAPLDVVTSLAGRVSAPRVPPGAVRVGGFGGPDGLVGHLTAERIDAVVDATHPFAARITEHAQQACARLGVPLIVLRRPGWTERAGDDWRRVADPAAAAALVHAAPAGTVLLTLGRRGLGPFAPDADHHYVIRSVDPPDAAEPLPPRRTVVLARGPFTADAERAFLREHDVSLLVTKDSGGTATAAKLDVARESGLPVVMLDRPPLPPGLTCVAAADDAERWVLDLARSTQ